MLNAVVLDTCVLVDVVLPSRPRHLGARALYDRPTERNIGMREPAFALFEMLAAIRQESGATPPTFDSSFTTQSPLTCTWLPIDTDFVDSYFDPTIPFTRAGDLVFLSLAKKETIPLVTEDDGLARRARQCGVSVYRADELLTQLHA